MPQPVTPTMYRGRFAPSPTGPLHLGSLVAAVGSYLDAKAQHGEWLLRIEDIDPPREMPGASDGILRTLDAYGFEWDGRIVYQSHRTEAYEAALDDLIKQGKVYPCACSRKEIADSAQQGVEGPVYPGTCRHGAAAGKTARAWRLRVPDATIAFTDRIQGRVEHNLAKDIGDFVLKRADGLYSYQLAVVVDDAAQAITHVVRGIDLLHSTPRQLYLQTLLGLPNPVYAHLPLVLNAQGQKLSKQNLAQALNLGQTTHLLCTALAFLGQNPPADLAANSLPDIWRWARANWSCAKVPITAEGVKGSL